MALPGSGSISLHAALAELQTANAGRALPISLQDADVRAMAGKLSGPISLQDLYGKSAVHMAGGVLTCAGASSGGATVTTTRGYIAGGGSFGSALGSFSVGFGGVAGLFWRQATGSSPVPRVSFLIAPGEGRFMHGGVPQDQVEVSVDGGATWETFDWGHAPYHFPSIETYFQQTSDFFDSPFDIGESFNVLVRIP